MSKPKVPGRFVALSVPQLVDLASHLLAIDLNFQALEHEIARINAGVTIGSAIVATTGGRADVLTALAREIATTRRVLGGLDLLAVDAIGLPASLAAFGLEPEPPGGTPR